MSSRSLRRLGTIDLICPLILVCFVLAYWLPTAFFLSFDEEVYRTAGVFLFHRAEALLSGRYPFWEVGIGLGTPLPFAETLDYHPIVILAMFLKKGTCLAILSLTHLLVGTSGIYCLCRFFKINQVASLAAAATYLLGPPTLNYFVTDYWIVLLVFWSMLPWIWWLMLRLFAEPNLRNAAILGVVAGWSLVQAHFGTLVPYALASILFLACCAWSRKGAAFLVVSSFIALGIFFPRFFQVWQGFQTFPPDAIREVENTGKFFLPSDLLFFYHSPRTFFLGLPFLSTILLLFSANLRDRKFQSLLLVFLVNIGMYFVPAAWLGKSVSTSLMWRDTALITGCLAAGYLITNAVVLSSGFGRRLGTTISVIQIACMCLAVSPWWYRSTQAALSCINGKPVGLRSVVEDTPFVDYITELTRQRPGRVYVSRLADKFRLQFGFTENSLVLNNIPVFNFLSKGWSTHALYPDLRLMTSGIQPVTSGNRPEFSLALQPERLAWWNVRYLVSYEGEKAPEGLQLLKSFSDGDRTLSVYENENIQPRIFLANNLDELPAAIRNDSKTPLLLRKDIPAFTSSSPKTEVAAVFKYDRIDAELPSSSIGRFLIVSQASSPGWRAFTMHGSSKEKELPMLSIGPSFIGVELPSSTKHVRFENSNPPFFWLSVAGSLWGFGWLLIAIIARPKSLTREYYPPKRDGVF